MGRCVPGIPLVASNARGRLEPIHVRHLYVHQDDVEVPAAGRLQCLATGADRDDAMTPSLEQVADEHVIELDVLRQQHVEPTSFLAHRMARDRDRFAVTRVDPTPRCVRRGRVGTWP